jgi:AcrR family transcriptional regulator
MPPAAANHEKLIETAVDLFSIHGFDGVSIRDLCRSVGIKESSFYNHFRSKDELLSQVMDLFRERWRRLLPPETMLDSLVDLREPQDFWDSEEKHFRAVTADTTMCKLTRILILEQYRHPLARALIQEEILQRPLHYCELVFDRFAALGKIRAREPRRMAAEYRLPFYTLLLQHLSLQAAGEDTAPVEGQLSEHILFFSRIVQA